MASVTVDPSHVTSIHYIKEECGPLKSSFTASPISLREGVKCEEDTCPVQSSIQEQSKKQVKQGDGDKVEDHVDALPRSAPQNLLQLQEIP